MFTKYQIALQYSPELENNPVLAVRRLRIMINRCIDLKTVLDHTGSKRYSKSYTPQQVKLIYYFLGDPPCRCSDSSLIDEYILSENDYILLNHYLHIKKRTRKNSEKHGRSY